MQGRTAPHGQPHERRAPRASSPSLDRHRPAGRRARHRRAVFPVRAGGLPGRDGRRQRLLPAGFRAQWQGAGRQRLLHRRRHPCPAVDRPGHRQPAVEAEAHWRRLLRAGEPQQRQSAGHSGQFDRPARCRRAADRQLRRLPGVADQRGERLRRRHPHLAQERPGPGRLRRLRDRGRGGDPVPRPRRHQPAVEAGEDGGGPGGRYRRCADRGHGRGRTVPVEERPGGRRRLRHRPGVQPEREGPAVRAHRHGRRLPLGHRGRAVGPADRLDRREGLEPARHRFGGHRPRRPQAALPHGGHLHQRLGGQRRDPALHRPGPHLQAHRSAVQGGRQRGRPWRGRTPRDRPRGQPQPAAGQPQERPVAQHRPRRDMAPGLLVPGQGRGEQRRGHLLRDVRPGRQQDHLRRRQRQVHLPVPLHRRRQLLAGRLRAAHRPDAAARRALR